MSALPYKLIKTEADYITYCNKLEALVKSESTQASVQDEIDLLHLLIKTYDNEHNTFTEPGPVELLRSLMKEHKMKAVDMAKLLHVSEGLVSDILHYKKGLSKQTIRILSEKFKLSHEAFNRPYKLKAPVSPKIENARMMNTRKKSISA